jgi:hypothetical protein
MSDIKNRLDQMKDTAQEKARDTADSMSQTAQDAFDSHKDPAVEESADGISDLKDKVTGLFKK